MALKSLVVKPGDDPPPPEVIAQSIVDIAAGMKRLNAGRLNRNALVLLLHHASRVGMRDIERVLEGLDSLERLYLKPKQVKP